jgi:hypothetical protein
MTSSADRHRLERRPVDEAGGGVSEGFELTEEELIEHASHGDDRGTASIFGHVGLEEPEISDAVYGEADEEMRDLD